MHDNHNLAFELISGKCPERSGSTARLIFSLERTDTDSKCRPELGARLHKI
jgi:hypothetical protein